MALFRLDEVFAEGLRSLGYTDRKVDAAIDDLSDASDVVGDVVRAGIVLKEPKIQAQVLFDAVVASRGHAKRQRCRVATADPVDKVLTMQRQATKLKEAITAEMLASQLTRGGVQIDADAIEMADQTELGSVVAELALHPEVSASVKVVVEKSKIVLV